MSNPLDMDYIMNNVLLVVDTRNLFNTLHKTFGNGKIDYQRYCELVGGQDHIYSHIAYGQQCENNSVNFITVLNKLGFVCKFKQLVRNAGKTLYFDSNVQLAIDVTEQVSAGKIDRVVLGSSDPALIDLIDWIRKTKGLRCDIVACRIPKVLKDACSMFIELDSTILLKPITE